MKIFYRKIFSICLFMAVLFMIVGTAAANVVTAEILYDDGIPYGVLYNDSTIYIRGPINDGSDIDSLKTLDTITMDATQFVTFYNDTDKNMTSETLTLK